MTASEKKNLGIRRVSEDGQNPYEFLGCLKILITISVFVYVVLSEIHAVVV